MVDVTKEVSELRKACESLEKAEGHVTDLRDRRDELVRAALAAGTPYAELREVTGLSRPMLDAIRRGRHTLRSPKPKAR